MDEAGVISLSDRRQLLTDSLFTKVSGRTNFHLLPTANTCHYNFRKQRKFQLKFSEAFEIVMKIFGLIFFIYQF